MIDERLDQPNESEKHLEQLQGFRKTLEQSLVRYEMLFDSAPMGYFILCANGTIIDANLTAAQLLETDRILLIHTNLLEFINPEYQDTLLHHLAVTFAQKGRQSCELELIRGDGNTFYAQLESIAQSLGEEQELQCLTVCTDISERRRQEIMIQRQANYDALTDLPNRVLFLDRLAYTMRLAQRECTSLALFFIDLDNFKRINDNLGHATGDRVLSETARRLAACARENDTVARLSGDEFCLLLPRVGSAATAGLVAEKVLAAMAEPFVLADGSHLEVACSIGIALYPKDADTSEALLKSADIALYQVKRAGRSHYAFFSRGMGEEILQRRQKLSLEIKQASCRDELTLRYQPVIELESGRPFGLEVLVRWRHPEDGLLAPCEFISIAESNGAIHELGEWVLRKVSGQVCHWQRRGAELSAIWVNLSVRQCGNIERARRLTALLDEMNVWTGPPRLGLEITEGEALGGSEPTAWLFDYLHRQGISLSVDDFGTGHFSLGRFMHLPVDFIKIDQSFVADIVASEQSANLVKATIAFGHSMNTRIVAEGIETREQLQMLRDLGCDYGQGFYISEPLSGDEVGGFIGMK